MEVGNNGRRRAWMAAMAWLALVNFPPPVGAQRGQSQRGELSSAEADLQKGIELTRSGKFREAIPHFLAARGQVRNEYALSFNLALCYVGTGQYRPAIELLNEVRAGGRGNAHAENLLAQALLGNQQPDEGFAAFQRSARLDPKNEKLYLYVADACLAGGYYDVGLKVVEAGRRRLPRSARLAFERGMLLAQLEFLDEAKQELQKATELQPSSDIAYIAAAQKSLLEGKVDNAVRAAGEGIHKGSQHFMLLALYGEAVLRSGAEPDQQEFADARRALEQAVAQRPSYPSAQLSLGKLYLMEGRLDDAIARLDAARELDPKNPAVYSNLATAYRQRGDTEQAEKMLAILARLNQEQVERIRSAPGDRKASYAGRTRPRQD